MDLLKKLFIFALFLFPLGEIIRINFGNGAVIKPLDIGVTALILSWLVFKFVKKQKIKQTNILVPVVLFVLSGLFSLIINNLHLSINEFLISFSYMLRWIAYAGVFFVVCDFDKDFKKKISKFLIIIGSIIVVLGYLQYFFYSSLKNLFYLGWDEHMYRLFSVFLDPNFAGAFFVLFFLFLINLNTNHDKTRTATPISKGFITIPLPKLIRIASPRGKRSNTKINNFFSKSISSLRQNKA